MTSSAAILYALWPDKKERLIKRSFANVRVFINVFNNATIFSSRNLKI